MKLRTLKKLLVASLCFSMLGLVACSKKAAFQAVGQMNNKTFVTKPTPNPTSNETEKVMTIDAVKMAALGNQILSEAELSSHLIWSQSMMKVQEAQITGFNSKIVNGETVGVRTIRILTGLNTSEGKFSFQTSSFVDKEDAFVRSNVKTYMDVNKNSEILVEELEEKNREDLNNYFIQYVVCSEKCSEMAVLSILKDPGSGQTVGAVIDKFVVDQTGTLLTLIDTTRPAADFDSSAAKGEGNSRAGEQSDKQGIENNGQGVEGSGAESGSTTSGSGTSNSGGSATTGGESTKPSGGDSSATTSGENTTAAETSTADGKAESTTTQYASDADSEAAEIEASYRAGQQSNAQSVENSINRGNTKTETKTETKSSNSQGGSSEKQETSKDSTSTQSTSVNSKSAVVATDIDSETAAIEAVTRAGQQSDAQSAESKSSSQSSKAKTESSSQSVQYKPNPSGGNFSVIRVKN